MHRLLEESDVDLSVPPVERCVREGTGPLELTLGDLHANAMKLIFFLVTEGVLEISPDVYVKLWNLYHTPFNKVTENTFRDFAGILRKNVSVLRTDYLVRLIGDELSDRGVNDFFVLIIFEKLVDSGVEFEILFSNHGSDFLKRFDYFIKRYNYGGFQPLPPPHVPQIDPLFTHSAQQLEKTLNNGCIVIDELVEKVNTCYKPYIKLLSFSLDKTNNEINIFSHSPIDIDDIKALAFYFKVPYNDGNIDTLGATIGAINKQAKPDLLYPHCNEPFSQSDSICRCAWNRKLVDLNRPAKHPNGFKMHWVHGHDSQYVPDSHVSNLDNELGKNLEDFKGKYTVLILIRTMLKPVQQLTTTLSRTCLGPFFSSHDSLIDDILNGGPFQFIDEDDNDALSPP